MRATLFVFVTWVASPALAAGFSIPEQGARSISLSGSGTASTPGASAIGLNPATLGFEDGISAEVGAGLIVPSFHYQPLRAADGNAVSAQTRLFVLPNLFAAFPVGPVVLGVGAYSNYGLGLTWPETWDGRYDATRSDLQTFTITPTVAWRLHRQVSIAAGFNLVRGTVELVRQLELGDQEGTVRLGGGTFGFGANAGVVVHFLADRLSLGAHYRSAAALPFSGRADFSAPVEFSQQLKDQNVRTLLVLPHTVALAASYRVVPALRLSLDATYTTWSTLDAIRLDFDDDALDSALERNWFNTLTVRAGAEYSLKAFTARLGAGFDPSPSPANTLSPSLPDASRIVVSAGVGYRLGNFSADLGYLLAVLLSRESEPDAFAGRYSGLAHVIGLTVAFRQ